jgi:hypothetical protein
LNAGVTLTQAVFQLAKANSTLKDTVATVFPVVNTGLDAYQTFRYHTVDDVTIRPLVIAAMQAKTSFYLGAAGKNPNIPMTFAGAVNAVNEIEYLCTRQGIAFLLNHGVAATNVSTDASGAIVFNSPTPNSPKVAGQK